MTQHKNASECPPQTELAQAYETIAALTGRLSEAQRTLDELIENSPLVVHIKDLDGKYVFVNKKYEEVTHLPRTAVLGQTVFEVYSPALASSEHARDVEVIRSAKSIMQENTVDEGAARRVFIDVKFPLFDANGAVRATAGFAAEITEQKCKEEALTKLAGTDALTGLANRRGFFDCLAQEFDRSRRYARSLAVIGLDIDHFKHINDNFGHATGDIVLRQVSELFLQALRSGDVVGRIGGEEFAILMPEAAAAEALEVAERLRGMVANAVLHTTDGKPLKVTVSMGVSCIRPEDQNFEAMLERADLALYQAKHNGRNRVSLGV